MNKKLLRNKKLFDFILIIIFILIGYLFASILKSSNVKVEKVYFNFLDIFFHNVSMALIIIVLTKLVSYPAILFNSFFLGINIFFSFKIRGIANTLFLLLHVPLEIYGWILTLSLSKKMFDFYSSIIYKKKYNINYKKLLLEICLFIIIFLIGAIVENSVYKIYYSR